MPGFYDEGKYDIAGFAVGIVDRKKIVDGRKIREGDALVGIASSGPHSSGFSLIRKVLPDLDEDFGGMPIGMALLEPTRLYGKPVLALMEEVEVRGMAHITGGGFYENIPRMFHPLGGKALDAVIKDPTGGAKGGRAWTIPPIFARIAYGVSSYGGADGGVGSGAKALTGAAAQAAGAELLGSDEKLRKLLFNTYNMGIGFVLALDPKDRGKAIEYLDGKGFPAWEIGRVVAGRGKAGELRFE
jgi:phosphoribosylformylglycinamidine cyclo-ligase